MQILLPIFPPELTLITPTLGFEEKNGFVYYFHSAEFMKLCDDILSDDLK